MNKWTVTAAVAAVALSACTPLSPGGPAGPGAPTETVTSPSAAPDVSTYPGASPLPDSELPLPFPLNGPLINSAAEVVEELHRVAGGLPVLKLDITRTQATLTALLADGGVASYRWSEDQITRVDSDIQYLEQATFDPSDFPLESAARMFDIADLRGVRGELVLQIIDYRERQVFMTITSRPESTTVFFRKDGTAVAELGYTSVADLTAGLDEVIDDATDAYAVGFNAEQGYWADLPEEPGVVLSRSRMGGLPVFETRRGETPAVDLFDPQHIEPATLAMVIARFQGDPAVPCDVRIDRSTQRSGAVVRVECEGEVRYADLEGRDMTALIEA